SVNDIGAQGAVRRVDATRVVPCGPGERAPAKLAPMLAQTSASLRSDPAWTYEPKVDGYRAIAFVRDGVLRLPTRRGLDLTLQFPEIVAALEEQAVARLVLDAEIIVLAPDGRPSFNAVQNRAQLKTRQEISAAQAASPAVLICFDILHFAGVNLREAPYV